MKKKSARKSKPVIQLAPVETQLPENEKCTIVHCSYRSDPMVAMGLKAERTLILVTLPHLHCYRLIKSYNIPMDGEDGVLHIPPGEEKQFTLVFEGFDKDVTAFFVYEPGVPFGFQTDFIERNTTDVYNVRFETLDYLTMLEHDLNPPSDQ